MSATIRIKRARDEFAPSQLMVEKRHKEDIDTLSSMVKKLGKVQPHVFKLATSTESKNLKDVVNEKTKRKKSGSYNQIKRWKEAGRSYLELQTSAAAKMAASDVVVDTYHYQQGVRSSKPSDQQSLFADTGILPEQIEIFHVDWDIEDFILEEEKEIKKVTFADEEQDSESEHNSRNDYPDEVSDSEIEQESEQEDETLYSSGHRNQSLRGESDLVPEDDEYVPFSYGVEPTRDTEFDDDDDLDYGFNYVDDEFDCMGISHFEPESNRSGQGAADLRNLINRFNEFAVDDEDIFDNDSTVDFENPEMDTDDY
eukprot:TRINITY_DN2476_c0_g2_i1.p2 TRINITY_DN2476_c0_g2~~TRINITY_DN2476_c0_g2_i1.p2  ORF type:complete len:312 (+),score=77.38 TRINITY_DN2476_c0_g2_i1:58-993(+)